MARITLALRRWLKNPLNAPAAGTMEEWDAWEQEARGGHPFLWFLLQTVPLNLSVTWRKFVTEPIWQLKYRLVPRHRYNIVRTGLKPGYYDQDMRLLHAAMTLLDSYVDEVGGIEELEEWTGELAEFLEPYGQGAADSQREAQEAFAEVWKWWHYWRPEREKLEKELLDWWHDDRYSGYDGRLWPDTEMTEEQARRLNILGAHEVAAAEEDTEMLTLLVKFRGHLWR